MGLCELGLGEYNNLVIAGESGSGKTELALCLCLEAAEDRSTKVVLADMDETKSLFRSRDAQAMLAKGGVTLLAAESFMDAPLVPHGVRERILDGSCLTVLDVGGTLAGPHCLGQYGDELRGTASAVLYVINPFRSFSTRAADVAASLRRLPLPGLPVLLVANPYYGPGTARHALEGGIAAVEELAGVLDLPVPLVMLPRLSQDPDSSALRARLLRRAALETADMD